MVEDFLSWTSFDRERRITARLVDRTPLVEHHLGVDDEGTDLLLYTLGDLSLPTLMIIGGVHGNELGAREGVLREMTRMAQRRLIPGISLAFIPSAVPAAVSRGTRNSPLSGRDLNSDFYRLPTLEGEAVINAIRIVQPAAMIDMHEYGGDAVREEVLIGRSMLPETHPLMGRWSRLAYEEMFHIVERAGWTANHWSSHARGTLRQISGELHAVGLLTETRIRDARIPRMMQNVDIIQGLVAWFTEHAENIQAASDASRARAVRNDGPMTIAVTSGSTATSPWDRAWIKGWTPSEPLPQKLIDAFDITVNTDGTIPAAQSARQILPMLMDEGSVRLAVPGERIYHPAPTPLSEIKVRHAGVTHRVVSMIRMTDAGRVPVVLSAQPGSLIPDPKFTRETRWWRTWGTTTGAWSVDTPPDGSDPAIHLHGDGLIRIETPLTTHREDREITIEADVWVDADGVRPGQLHVWAKDAGALVASGFNPAEGEMVAGWNHLSRRVTFAQHGAQRFALQLGQVSSGQTNPAWWRVRVRGTPLPTYTTLGSQWGTYADLESAGLTYQDLG